MRTTIVLDIETRPSRAVVDSPEWMARQQATIEAPGNYKDPEKIAAYKAAALQKLVAKAALNPLTGEIACIGIAKHFDAKPELIILPDLLDFLKWETANVVGFNIRDFDLPFLWVQCAMRGLDTAGLPRPRDYRRVGELRDIMRDGPLHEWSHAFGYPTEIWGQEEFERATQEQLEAKCLRDIGITSLFAKKFVGALGLDGGQ